MIVKQKYVCEFCNTEYDTEEECSTCEESHSAVNEIGELKYAPLKAYPTFIEVTTDSGFILQYSFNRIVSYAPPAAPEEEESE